MIVVVSMYWDAPVATQHNGSLRQRTWSTRDLTQTDPLPALLCSSARPILLHNFTPHTV